MNDTHKDALGRTLAIVLAGGQGERLYPLTKDRAKPAVPFAGNYRIIDFTLSNVANSGLRTIDILTQYKSHSLQRHLRLGWNIFNFELGESLEVIPPQQRMATIWYRGTADALFQNIYILERVRPEYVIILSGDHIYKMNYARMLEYHLAKKADLTVACIEVNRDEARRFGIMQVNEESKIIEFDEKPQDPKPMPGKPNSYLGSMGVYIFNTEELVRQVIADAKRPGTDHDFGRNIIPAMIRSRKVFVFNFADAAVGEVYWRDIGTLDAYWHASMDLLGPNPPFELADPAWRMRTYREQHPPARIISTEGSGSGIVTNSLISDGVVINDARVTGCVISPRVTIQNGASIEGSVIMSGTTIGAGAKIRNTIIDKNVRIPAGAEIGFDPDSDRRHFTVTDSGLVVIPKEMPFEKPAHVVT